MDLVGSCVTNASSPASKFRRRVIRNVKRGRASDWAFVTVIVVGLLGLLFTSIAVTLFVFWYIATHLRFGL